MVKKLNRSLAPVKGIKKSFYKSEFTAWDILNTALSYQATVLECCSLLEVSEKTLIENIEYEHGVSFLEYRERFINKNKVKFRQELFKMAVSGKAPGVSIFYAKNVLNMTDKTEVVSTNTVLTLEDFLTLESKKLESNIVTLQENKIGEISDNREDRREKE